MIPIVFHIPHSSRFIPAKDRTQLVPDDPTLEREVLAMTDAWTDELVTLAQSYNVRRVVAPVSRLVCDVERYRNDESEPMATLGMGAIYTRTSDGKALRDPAHDDRERLLATYYDPHHAKLTEAVDDALTEGGSCLIIDVHSFPSRPLPYEQDQSENRPSICIGFDSLHGRFLEGGQWQHDCRWAGLAGEANRPFSGSIVPAKHAGNANVMSVMIEVRRDLYMDERTGEKLAAFHSIAQKLAVLAVALASSATRHAEYSQKMLIPYAARVPLIWKGRKSHIFERAIDALGGEDADDAVTEAEMFAERVYSGKAKPADISHVPRAPEELAHFIEVCRQMYVADAIGKRIIEDGEVIDEYSYDGSGVASSPGSSFYACVKEWRGFFQWTSDLDSAGPFVTAREAIAGMRAHCGLTRRRRR